MKILGIGGYMHDFNCCLIDTDRQQLVMREAERTSRRKHHTILDEEDVLMPVRLCCEDLDINPKKIDVVVHGHTDEFPCKARIKAALPKSRHVEVDHHLCHAASAYYCSGFESAAIVSIDGFGDGASGLLAQGKGGKIYELERISDEHSIGLEYLRATVHIALGGYGSEGKTQGLAAYGEPTLYEAYMNEIDLDDKSGQMRLSNKLRTEESILAKAGGYINAQLLNNDFLNAYCPRRIEPEPLTETHKNLAASIQKTLEVVAERICKAALRRTGELNLVLSGGVSMNSSMNGYLMDRGLCQCMFALPMASDRGIGLGAALYHAHNDLDIPRFFKLKHVYFGGRFSEKEAIRAMKTGRLKIHKADDCAQEAAEALASGKIIGWFQGRSELGARALGNRSILADPRRADMKDIVNLRVKHREWFRPFAPVIPAERAAEYFEFGDKSADLSFMTFTVRANERARHGVPAVVHVDGTARVQTVYRNVNPRYVDVIDKFEAITGVPILLNTSFNDRNEPIVETPENAVKMFLNSDMDMLVIGDMVGVKG